MGKGREGPSWEALFRDSRTGCSPQLPVWAVFPAGSPVVTYKYPFREGGKI